MSRLNDIEKLRGWCHKILPLVYDDSLSYYEVLCKVRAKINEVIDLTAEQNDVIEEAVQEITDWETTTDDKYNQFVAQMDEAFDTFKGEINNEVTEFESTVNGTVTNYKNAINASELEYKNQMQALYDEFLQSYLQTLGVVQTTGQSTTDVMSQKATTDLVEDLNNKLYTVEYYEHSGFMTASGNFSNDTSTHCKYTNKIPVTPGDVIRYKGVGEYQAISAIFYNANRTIVSSVAYQSVSDYTNITIPSDVSFVVFSSYAGVNQPVILDVQSDDIKYGDIYTLKNEVNSIDNAVNCNKAIYDEQVPAIANFTSNEINLDKCVDGYISGGTLIVDSSYKTSDYIPIDKKYAYVKCVKSSTLGASAPGFHFYDKNKNYISAIYGTQLDEDWFTVSTFPTNAVYIRISTGSAYLSAFYLGKGNAIVNPIPSYGFELGGKGTISASQIRDLGAVAPYIFNELKGKKWYVLGDSATHGDWTGATTEYIQDGLYQGQLAVYPFFIGNRTGMDVHNMAHNGGVMATLPDQPERYQLSKDGNYDAVPEDADYITIWLGANDMWQNVTIGDINSTDPTTFYGAYKKVLNWYITNRPKAKIGLVASFWCTQEYAEAVIDIGAKFGIPVLNLYSDPNIPVTIGSLRTDVLSSVKSTREVQYRVSQSNGHPNATFHELQSWWIEEWLKTL